MGYEEKRREHQDKVRLKKEDIQDGNITGATARINDRDGGLAKHATLCPREIDWDGAKIVGKEQNWTQRKLLEGIETLRQMNEGFLSIKKWNMFTVFLFTYKTMSERWFCSKPIFGPSPRPFPISKSAVNQN